MGKRAMRTYKKYRAARQLAVDELVEPLPYIESLAQVLQFWA
ncbi:hypothetical protein BGP_6270 [Beggiatoa sp. PS]|nr:hypothetical protein BGP_6270 [Beggiatoa sp. PS]